MADSLLMKLSNALMPERRETTDRARQGQLYGATLRFVGGWTPDAVIGAHSPVSGYANPTLFVRNRDKEIRSLS
jgi:hypothetical protein